MKNKITLEQAIGACLINIEQYMRSQRSEGVLTDKMKSKIAWIKSAHLREAKRNFESLEVELFRAHIKI